MFKRANKITALVVAAASIMSVVPAMAATKLGTKDGTVEEGIAFKDGKYIYQGYRTDDDDSGIYYNAGDKDKKLDDVTKLGIKFDDKYVQAKDGSDEYIVDLSTGKLTDEDTVKDLRDTAETKLINKLRKTDRYAKGYETTFGINDQVVLGDRVQGGFGDIWYEYSATTVAGVSVDTATSAQVTAALAGSATTAQSVEYGYTNASGTYVDASHNANIYVYKSGDKMVKIENVGDTEDGITLNSITPVATLGQDDKYIYRVVAANVTGANKIKLTNGDDSTDYTSGNTNYNQAGDTLYYVQKIAKAQGDKEKDAYLPKTTDSFQISGFTGNGDVKDAFTALMKLSDVPSYSDATAISRIVDGAIYVTFSDDAGDKVKTIKVVLKTSEKLYQYSGDNKITSADKIDGHVAKKDGDKDTKVENDSNSQQSWTVDTKGTVWAIEDGEIKKSVKLGDFTTVYTVDRSMDSIDVYDENNLMAWDNGGDVYTNVTEGEAAAKAEAGTIVNPTPANIGWKQEGTAWTFYDATGTKVVNNWVNDKGTWYFIKEDGTMATGWQQVGGTWYFLNASGAMLTGWYNDNGTWYYLQSSGAMKTGWLNDSGTWYYLNASGAMLANTTVDGYVLNGSGAWVK